MSVKKLFEWAIDNSEPLTEEQLSKFKRKVYFNGDEMQVGDIVLFAFVVDQLESEDAPVSWTDDGHTISEDHVPEIPEISLHVACLNEKHFDEFEPHPHRPTYMREKHAVPVLNYVGDGDYFNSENISE